MSIQACAEIVHRGDPDRFRAVMAAPVALRARLFPLYAMNVEVARAPWVTQEAMIAEMRLQWWRDVLGEIGNGGTPRAHEVTTPLAQILTPEMAQRLDGLVAARRWDIYRDPFADQGEFDAYIAATSGALYQVACGLAGADLADTAADFGYAAGVANWFLAVPQLEALGRIPLVDGRPQAVQALARTALARLHQAKAHPIPGQVKPVFWAGWQAQTLLRRAIADPKRVANGTLARSEARKRLSLLLKSSFGRV